MCIITVTGLAKFAAIELVDWWRRTEHNLRRVTLLSGEVMPDIVWRLMRLIAFAA
jgi:hypothetical protein